MLAVLDVGLPDLDGFEVCRRLRERSDVPVLFLTARDDEVDRIAGFEVGADDYVVKPFSPKEVVARVRRDPAAGPAGAAEYGDQARSTAIVVDAERREVTVEGEPVALATQEFELLAFLVRNRGWP